jgi:hypothetical protein
MVGDNSQEAGGRRWASFGDKSRGDRLSQHTPPPSRASKENLYTSLYSSLHAIIFRLL